MATSIFSKSTETPTASAKPSIFSATPVQPKTSAPSFVGPYASNYYSAPVSQAVEKVTPSITSKISDFFSTISSNAAKGYQKVENDFSGKSNNIVPAPAAPSLSINRGGSAPANDLQNALSSLSLPNFLVKNPVTDVIGSALDEGVNKVQGFINTLGNNQIDPTKNKTPVQRLGAGLDAVNAVSGLIFSPFTAALKLAEQTPVLKYPAEGIDMFFSKVGEKVNTATLNAVNMLPVSQETKDALAQPIANITTLMAQVYLGGKLHEDVVPKVKEDLIKVKTLLTKDIIDQHLPDKSIYLSPEKVKDIFQTGKLLTPEEQSDFAKVVGSDRAKIKDAFQNGITINISPERIITLQDKPYWAKIKSVFGIEASEPEIISKTGGSTTQGPRGYLEPGTPTAEDIKSVAEEIKNPPLSQSSQYKDDIERTALGFQPAAPEIEGLDLRQGARLSADEAHPLSVKAADHYWNRNIQPMIEKGKAVIIGSDNLKDYFGRDYNSNNHPVYSQAADLLYEKAVANTKNPVVKFTVGGTGSGKSDFLVPDMANNFSGVVYDSTGFNYEGIKKQIDYAKSLGKKPEVYAIVPDIARSRAYTLQREANGEHPVSEAAFIKTHSQAIETLIKLIKDGVDVHIIDTRDINTREDIQNAGYVKNPLDLLQSLEYDEDNVKRSIAGITKENAQALIEGGKEGFGKVSEENRASEIEQRKKLPEVPTSPERIAEYKNRLKLRGVDPVLVDAIITPTGNTAYGVNVGGNILFEKVVEQFTEDHEIFHQIFQNFEKMRLFKGFDRAALLAEAKDLYGDLPEGQLEEEMAKDFQQYVNDREAGKESGFYGEIKDFFSRLFASLKRLFRNLKDIEEFYRVMREESATEETTFDVDKRLENFIQKAKTTGEIDFRKEQYALGKFLEKNPLEKVFDDKGNLTLKTLTKLKGRATVSKQFIEDLSNSGDIKQVERDLIRSILETESDQVNVSEFAEKVKAELLPLKRDNFNNKEGYSDEPRYESITLPDNLRGNVANYSEHIYQSPVKTAAGDIHFGGRGSDNYFGHTRVEDMASEANNISRKKLGQPESMAKYDIKQGTTRRIIEVQSDLYQKGGLEREGKKILNLTQEELESALSPDEYNELLQLKEKYESSNDLEVNLALERRQGELLDKAIQNNPRTKEVAKLQQYNDPTAHFRMVREEVKKAAEDGKTKLQFPTGETAMKIEGLGRQDQWGILDENNETSKLTPDHMKVGQRVYVDRGQPINEEADEWIITDVLGDGKFKAVPKGTYEEFQLANDTGDPRDLANRLRQSERNETFDISGKVDTNNPIYRFYEKDLGRYLKNNYGAKPVTDDKGVTWMEVNVDPAYAELPVPAFNEKPEDIDQLRKMLAREQESLNIALANPAAHARAYGPDRIAKYQARIADLVDRIAKAKTPTFKTGNKIEDLRKTLEAVEKRVGIQGAPVDFEGNTLVDLEERQVVLEAMKDSIENNGLKNLEKFEAKTGIFKGELPEVTGKSIEEIKQSKLYGKYRDKNVLEFMQKGDKYIGEAGFEDSEEARAAYQQFKEQKAQYKSILRNFTDDVKKYTSFVNQDIKSLEETGKQIPVTLDELEPPVVRGDIQSPKLDFRKWKDRAVLRLNRDTFERNIEKVAPKEDAQKVKDFLVNPVRENELARTKFNNELKTNIKKKVRDLKIKRNSQADELIQIFGEGRMSLDELKKAAPTQWKQIESAAGYFRNIYDDLLDTWNEERKKYGYAPIPKVPNYFRHFDEINFFVQNFGFLRSQDELPTEIAGKTEFFKPGKPFSTAELRRTGDSTKYSAIGGFNNYIESVSKQIFHIDSVQRGRALEKYMEASAKLAKRIGEPLFLSNVVSNFREYVNNGLAGKTATLDRSIENTLGRPSLRTFKTIARLIGKNIIVGNLSTALSHLVTLPLIGATTDKVPIIKGAMTTLVSPLRQEPFSVIDGQESSFLVRRFPLEEIMPSMPKTAENALSYVFAVTDKFKSKLAVASKYYEGISKGLSKEEAMKQADIYGGKVIGDYSLGQKPNLMNTKFTSLIAQFQLGLNDSVSVLLHDIPEESSYEETNDQGETKKQYKKWQIASRLIQFAIFSYLFNLLLKKVRGSGKGIDPIEMGLTLAGLNDEGDGQSFPQRLALAGTDLAGELPFTSAFTGNFPLATALTQPVKDLLAGDYGKMTEDILATFGSPIGGGLQAKKTIEGYQAIKKNETSGIAEAARALFFGASAKVTPLSKVSNDLETKVKTATTKLNEYDPALIKKVQPIFNQVVEAGFGTEEGDALIGDLSDTEYTVYKAIKSKYLAENNLKMESKILPIVQKANDLGFGTPEADQLINDNFPDTAEGNAEYESYTSIKNALYGVNNQKNESLGTWDKQSFIDHIVNIAKAVGTDPVTAFDDIFAGNSSWKIVGQKNGQILVQRMSEAQSQEIKKKRGGANAQFKLDHSVSIASGGSNGSDNLQLIPTGDENTPGTWAWNTKTEDMISKALGEGKITGAEAREYMIRFKATAGEPLSPALQQEFKDKYNSEPLTLEQIRDVIANN